ncbi:unnamed protein product [Ectocarpus sp. 13 AM-2016]
MLMAGIWGGGQGAQLGEHNANSLTAMLVAVLLAGRCRSTPARHYCNSDFIGRNSRGADHASILFFVALAVIFAYHRYRLGAERLLPFFSSSSSLPPITRAPI